MPTRLWKFRITDIIDSVNKIESYTEGLTAKSFKASGITVDAVIRNIEVIGEAANHIPIRIRKKYPLIPWDQMRGIRNLMAHEYFGVDLDVVWYTVTKDLIPLRKEFENIQLIEEE